VEEETEHNHLHTGRQNGELDCTAAIELQTTRHPSGIDPSQTL